MEKFTLSRLYSLSAMIFFITAHFLVAERLNPTDSIASFLLIAVLSIIGFFCSVVCVLKEKNLLNLLIFILSFIVMVLVLILSVLRLIMLFETAS